jgi:hypothetical protein
MKVNDTFRVISTLVEICASGGKNEYALLWR